MTSTMTALLFGCGAWLALSAIVNVADAQEDLGHTADLAGSIQALAAAWGPCDENTGCRWDLNVDGVVNNRDLLMLLASGVSSGQGLLDADGRTIINVNHTPPIVVESGWSSGQQANAGRTASRTAPHILAAPGGDWVRLRFADWNLGSRSSVTITSMLDGHSQRFTQRTLDTWRGYTAFFSGDRVSVELEIGPGEQDVFVDVREVHGGYETTDGPLSTLCGSDNRVSSNDARVGRFRSPGGGVYCTAWLASNGAVLTAGHCVDDATGTSFGMPDGTLVEFDIPDSSNCGTPQQPAPEDQFPIDVFTNPQFDSTQVGQDWAVIAVNPNANGDRPHILRGFFRMTRESPAAANTIRITGCGWDSTPTGGCGGNNSDNQTLQTSTGPYVEEVNVDSRYYHRYQTDTMGQNSGSPIIWNSNGVTIGIHTHAGCNSDGTGANRGTSFEHQPLENALEEFPPGASAANTVFVDNGWPDLAAENGTVLRPYDTIANGVSLVPAGGLLSVVEGSYGETITITKAMLVRAPVGSVVIGN